MIFDRDYILKRIIDNKNVQRVDVFEGHIEKGANPFYRIGGRSEDNASFERNIQSLILNDNIHANFTFFLRSEKQHIRTADRVQVKLGSSALQGSTQPTNAVGSDELNRMVDERIAAIKNAEDIQALREENESLKSPLNKASYLFEIIIEKVAERYGPKSAVTPMNGAVKRDEIFVDNEEELTESLEFLTQAFGVDGINKIADKLKNDPSKIDLLKNLI